MQLNEVAAKVAAIYRRPWVTVVASGATTPVSPTAFSNNWTLFDASHPIQYRMVGDRVEIRGWAKSGTSGTSIFTIPTALRPTRSHVFTIDVNSAVSLLVVGSDGTIVPGAGNTIVTLDGVWWSVL